MALNHIKLPHCPVTNKISFMTEAEARARAKVIRKRGRAKMVACRCWYCPYFHLGHNRTFKRRQEIDRRYPNGRLTKKFT